MVENGEEDVDFHEDARQKRREEGGEESRQHVVALEGGWSRDLPCCRC